MDHTTLTKSGQQTVPRPPGGSLFRWEGKTSEAPPPPLKAWYLLGILGLGLGASETDIKVHYRQLARKYHPDKNNSAITGLTATEASDFFKLLNNAQAYLKERV